MRVRKNAGAEWTTVERKVKRSNNRNRNRNPILSYPILSYPIYRTVSTVVKKKKKRRKEA